MFLNNVLKCTATVAVVKKIIFHRTSIEQDETERTSIISWINEGTCRNCFKDGYI